MLSFNGNITLIYSVYLTHCKFLSIIRVLRYRPSIFNYQYIEDTLNGEQFDIAVKDLNEVHLLEDCHI